jgi:hypothetical protein
MGVDPADLPPEEESSCWLENFNALEYVLHVWPRHGDLTSRYDALVSTREARFLSVR